MQQRLPVDKDMIRLVWSVISSNIYNDTEKDVGKHVPSSLREDLKGTLKFELDKLKQNLAGGHILREKRTVHASWAISCFLLYSFTFTSMRT